MARTRTPHQLKRILKYKVLAPPIVSYNLATNQTNDCYIVLSITIYWQRAIGNIILWCILKYKMIRINQLIYLYSSRESSHWRLFFVIIIIQRLTHRRAKWDQLVTYLVPVNWALNKRPFLICSNCWAMMTTRVKCWHNTISYTK